MLLARNFFILYFWILIILPALEAKASDMEALEHTSDIAASSRSTTSLKEGKTEDLNEVLSSLDKPYSTKAEDKTTNERKDYISSSGPTVLCYIEKPSKSDIWYVVEKLGEKRVPLWKDYIGWQKIEQNKTMEKFGVLGSNENKLSPGEKAIVYASSTRTGCDQGTAGFDYVLDIALRSAKLDCPEVFVCYAIRSEKEPTAPLQKTDFEKVLMSVGYVTNPHVPFGVHLGIFRSAFWENAPSHIPNLSFHLHGCLARYGLEQKKTHMVCNPVSHMRTLFVKAAAEKGNPLKDKIFSIGTAGETEKEIQIPFYPIKRSNVLEFIREGGKKGLNFSYKETTLTVSPDKEDSLGWFLLNSYATFMGGDTFIINLDDLAKFNEATT